MLFLGIDVGTSGCKTLLLDDTGTVLCSDTQTYPLSHPRSGWYEQSPEDWWQAVCVSIQCIMKKAAAAPADIGCIGLSAQMHGLVALDKNNHVLRPAILWNDQRSTAQCDEILKLVGGLDNLLALTNNNIIPGYTASKILWMRENEPELFAQTCRVMNPKDYIRYRLTGEWITEVSDASGTGLFDVKNRCWSDKLLQILDISRALLPKCCESTEITGGLTSEAANQTRLAEGTPVSGGGGDAVIQTTGSGLLEKGVMATIIGTAGIVAAGLNEFVPNVNGELQMFCNNAPGLWHMMGVSFCAGEAYKWYKNLLFKNGVPDGGNPYNTLNTWAAQSPAGSNRLLFLPYICGERCPHNDANTRGAFIGLEYSHTLQDMTRSVMEGVCFNMRQIGDKMPVQVKEIRASGGGAQSPLWLQIMADVFQQPVVCTYGAEEGGAYGAALVAGISIKHWRTPDEAMSTIRKKSVTEPNTANREIYDELYGIYKQIYPALQSVNGLLAK